jgi:hypothetical protein
MTGDRYGSLSRCASSEAEAEAEAEASIFDKRTFAPGSTTNFFR